MTPPTEILFTAIQESYALAYFYAQQWVNSLPNKISIAQAVTIIRSSKPFFEYILTIQNGRAEKLREWEDYCIEHFKGNKIGAIKYVRTESRTCSHLFTKEEVYNSSVEGNVIGLAVAKNIVESWNMYK